MSDPADRDLKRDREIGVEEYLRGLSVELAGLYGEARQKLREQEPAGWPYLVAHICRELMNRLPDYLEVPVLDPEAAGRTEVSRVDRQLRESLEGDIEELKAGVEAVLREIDRKRRRVDAAAAALLPTPSEESEQELWVSQWRRVREAFVAAAHVRGPQSPPPDSEKLEAAFREMTALIAARIAEEPFFDSLDDLKAIAHSEAPDVELAGSALARLRPGTAASFFSELTSSDWVGLLTELGVFSREPPQIVRNGDYVTFPPWPEGQVLLRFAGSAPELVAAAARAVPASENASVANVLAETALLLPASLVSGALARRVATDLRSSARLLGLPITAGSLVSHLAAEGQMAAALSILAALLQVDVQTEESQADFLPDRKVGRFTNNSYDVAEATEGALSDLLAGDALSTFAKLLKQLRGAQKRMAFQDSTGWRDAVAGPDERPEFELRHLLLQLLREAGTYIVTEEPERLEEALALLEAEESEIFLRLRMHLLARSNVAASQVPQLLENPEVLFKHHCRPEVRELLGAAWPGMAEETKATVLGLISPGPDVSRLHVDVEGNAEIVRAYRDEVRLALLEPLDSLLDDERQLWLDQLRAARGPIEPLPRSGWMGSESPASVAELTAMDPASLPEYLRDFRPERHFGGPSRAGLARELTEAIGQDPEPFEAILGQLSELPRIYVRAVLQGLDKALRGGRKLAEERVLEGLAWTLSQPVVAGDPVADEDPSIVPAQLAAVDALASFLRSDPPIGYRNQIFELIELAAQSSDPSTERDAKSEEPMTLAIGCVRGRAVELLLDYLGWLHRGGIPSEWDAAPEAQALLELLKEDPARAVRAMLGAHLPQLVSVGAEWAREHHSELVDPNGDERAQAGWEAYLRYTRVFGPAVEILTESYEAASVRLGAEPHSDDEARDSLAEHIAVIWRDLYEQAPDLLTAFLAHGDDRDRARLIGALGRALRPEGHGDYEPSSKDLDRHRVLWSERLAAGDLGTKEAEEFGYFWTSGQLDRADDVERLALTLRRANGKLKDIRRAIGLLAERLGKDPALAEPAMAVLKAIVEEQTAQAQHLQVVHLHAILEAGLREPDSAEAARTLIHALGQQGFLQLRALLD